MRAYERFLNYVPVWTTSDETSDTVPSADLSVIRISERRSVTV